MHSQRCGAPHSRPLPRGRGSDKTEGPLGTFEVPMSVTPGRASRGGCRVWCWACHRINRVWQSGKVAEPGQNRPPLSQAARRPVRACRRPRRHPGSAHNDIHRFPPRVCSPYSEEFLDDRTKRISHVGNSRRAQGSSGRAFPRRRRPSCGASQRVAPGHFSESGSQDAFFRGVFFGGALGTTVGRARSCGLPGGEATSAGLPQH